MPKSNAAVQKDYQACPNCGAGGASLMGFTLWGGLLGAKLLTHVKCPNCGSKYNGKTGVSNTVGIIIYTAVSAVVGIVLVVLIATLAR